MSWTSDDCLYNQWHILGNPSKKSKRSLEGGLYEAGIRLFYANKTLPELLRLELIAKRYKTWINQQVN